MKKLIVLLFPLFLFGCKEDEVKKTDSELLAEFFAEYEPKGITRTVDADSQNVILGDKAHLYLDAYSFHENGPVVFGEIQIEFRELYYKSDFLFANKQTITNNGELLQSAGVFYVKATQNGRALKFRGGAIIIYDYLNVYPALSSAAVNSMKIYKGGVDSNNSFEWTNAQNPNSGTGVFPNLDGSLSSIGLIISTNDTTNAFIDSTFEDLEWINCDDVLSDTLPTTFVSVTVDGNWGVEAVAQAFLVFKEINSVLNLYQQDSVFVSPGNIPITFTATVVVIAVNDGAYYFGTKDITVAATNNIMVTVAETSKADMATAIKTLDD